MNPYYNFSVTIEIKLLILLYNEIKFILLLIYYIHYISIAKKKFISRGLNDKKRKRKIWTIHILTSM